MFGTTVSPPLLGLHRLSVPAGRYVISHVAMERTGVTYILINLYCFNTLRGQQLCQTLPEPLLLVRPRLSHEPTVLLQGRDESHDS